MSMPLDGTATANDTVPSAPVLVVPASFGAPVGRYVPVPVSLVDPGSTDFETYTVSVTATNGQFTFDRSLQPPTSSITVSGPLYLVMAGLQRTELLVTGPGQLSVSAGDNLGIPIAPVTIPIMNAEPVNRAPVLTPVSSTVTLGRASPIAITLSEADATPNEQFSVIFYESNGSGYVNTPTLSGTLDQVQTALSSLLVTQLSAADTTLHVEADDSRGLSTKLDLNLTALPARQPLILAPGTVPVPPRATSVPVTGLSLSGNGAPPQTSYSVTINDETAGTLTASGLGVSGSGTGTLTVAGSLDQVNAELGTLVDELGPYRSGDLIINATDSTGSSAAPVYLPFSPQIAASFNVPETEFTAGQSSAITIGGITLDLGTHTATGPLTIRLDDQYGTLAIPGAPTTVLGPASLEVTGSSVAELDNDLRTLSFTSNVLGQDDIHLQAFDGGELIAQGDVLVSVGPAPLPDTPGTIRAFVSRQPGGGDAAFTLAVDGEPAGSYVADRDLGHGYDDIRVGDFGPGRHIVTATFTNDSNAGPGADRNLYVNFLGTGTDLGSTPQTGTSTSFGNVFYSNGSRSFAVGTPDTNRDDLVVSVSEDAYAGDAQFTLAVDGVTTGKTYTAVASHALGQSQDIVLTGYGPGPHAVTATFLNDADAGPGQDRNLYVNSITSGGATTLGGGLYSAGSVTFQSAGGAAADPTSTVDYPLTANIAADLPHGNDGVFGGALYTLEVDGQQVGGVRTAVRQRDASGTDVSLGRAPAGRHIVRATFLNDTGPGPDDRNLYVLNAAGAHGSELAVNGSQTFQGGDLDTSDPNAITVSISEDAWAGDAQFVLSVDGTQVGGIHTASGLHALGQTQDIVLGDYAAGAHTVTAMFLNDANGGTPGTDRNLYVDSITAGHTTIPGGALFSTGASSFSAIIPTST